ncbi:disulfide bond formation protein DsbA [Brumimicrobium salinarum]|uniref:Disulfide bond formation protein DsbA n=2 Tax=Brumimicrobium salinarum TaxID=2058658 RepID=A0A2I0R4J2_9FLAO|nr:disulfide bond formation protein DsbA [Brumimicrobium salinarum]
MNMENKMKIEIWSDVMCPFCYIGKRNLEKALTQFSDREHIEVIWKSYLLDPNTPETSDKSYAQHLVEYKGMSEQQVDGMLAQLTQTAKQAGLDYDFDKAQLVSSKKAHQVIQMAKTKGLGNQAEEVMFKAFFTEGKNIADKSSLISIGEEIGLSKDEVETALSDNKYAEMMNADIAEARQIGVQGVPFFVFNRKYAVSGAQPPKAFLESLEKAFGEWREDNPAVKLDITQGQSCKPDGTCD